MNPVLAILAALGAVLLVVLVLAIRFTVWACILMFVAWLAAYPLSWAVAYAVGILTSLVLTALRRNR